MNILTEEAKEYLAEVYGDLDIYITSKIESEVNFFKKDVGIIWKKEVEQLWKN